jgi:hypothetical protein
MSTKFNDFSGLNHFSRSASGLLFQQVRKNDLKETTMPAKTSKTSCFRFSLFSLVLILGVLAGLQPVPASAGAAPSSALLLPWFEVHLAEGRTTLFAVGNSAAEKVTVEASVGTNWGIPVLERTFELAPGEVRTVNLREWIAGRLCDARRECCPQQARYPASG